MFTIDHPKKIKESSYNLAGNTVCLPSNELVNAIEQNKCFVVRQKYRAQCMIKKLIKIGRYNEIEMNVGKKYSNENLRATNPNTDNGRSKQLQNVKYFKYLGCLINYARYIHEIKSRMAMAKAAFNKKNVFFTRKQDLNLRNKLVKCYIWSAAGAVLKIGTLRKVGHKYLEGFEMVALRGGGKDEMD